MWYTPIRKHYYLCIKTVIMNGSDNVAYIRGVAYPCICGGCILDEKGTKDHYWSQEAFLSHFADLGESAGDWPVCDIPPIMQKIMQLNFAV